MSKTRRIAFLYVGGVHHVAHTLPVAAALSRHEDVEVSAFCADAAVEAEVRGLLADFPDARVDVRRLKRIGLLDRFGRPSLAKLPMLWRSRGLLRRFDALVSAECTTIALRRMGVTRPLFFCQPHGAGDRAISFEPRFRRFDRVLVAGPKSARRMVDNGVSPDRVRQVGYPKAEYLADQARAATRPFDNDRPTVLYNPHFRAELSSLAQAPAIVRAITAGCDVNVIVAPHIRAFENASEEDLDRWRSLAVPGRVLVDTGSPRMIDMSHVAVADLYLGDVSSQVYEFLLLKPRPCLFINAHGVRWSGDPDYAFWRLGEVVAPADVVPGIRTALGDPDRFVEAQRAAVAETFGSLKGSADRSAAAILASFGEPR
ncbi:hypothetical protein GGQ97_002010 [Sphingomonas kaistensis]|uniref:Glycosyl transferase n=1 Tax=Sphingomonas kaistensis TaxID=298708 RepID=A0A7X6BHL1_9SPHN|nr:hypothetical protein [Sphingomonas kaistensis]NJC06217.1 hypothetical protein [Sphingomonas kaistensis]